MTFSFFEICWKYFVSFIIFAILKVYVHVFAYKRIIYKDDGRDYVSIKEFIAIHVTFSILYSWISYLVLYTFISSIYILLNYDENSTINNENQFILTKEGWG